MLLRVRERGDEVHVDVDGVAGRQQCVLNALSELQRGAGASADGTAGRLSIRASADTLRIRFRQRGSARIDATAIYWRLREALLERAAPPDASLPAR
jgi:hypothetical protein